MIKVFKKLFPLISKFSKYKELAFIFVFALSLRILLLSISIYNEFDFLISDSIQYKEIASAISVEKSYSNSLQNLEHAELIRTPGYPLFISIFYSIFGENDILLITMNIIINMLSIYYIFKILIVISNRKIANLGAFLFSVEPITISLVYYVLPQILFQFIIIFLIYTSVTIIKGEIKNNPFLLGLLLAIGTMVKPVMFYIIIPFLVGILLYSINKKFSPKKIVKIMGMTIIPIILIVGGWLYRNHLIVGYPTISHIKAVDLFYFKAPSVLAIKDRISFEEARKIIVGDKKVWHWIKNNPSSSEIKQLESKSIFILLENYKITIDIWIKGIINTLFGPGDGQFYGIFGKDYISKGPLGDIFRLSVQQYYVKWLLNEPRMFLLFIYNLVYLGILYAGLILYLFFSKAIDQEVWVSTFVLLGLLYFVLCSGGLETYYRFRNPMIPFMVLLLAQGWGHILFAHNETVKIEE